MENNTNPQQDPNQQPAPAANTTAQEYSMAKAQSNSRKLFIVIIIISVGLIVIAGIAVAAYLSNGSRTEKNINELETELREPDGSQQQAPDTN